MVLDSPSTLAGTDPFFLQRQRALPRVLRSICGRACRSFTRSPIGDMTRVADRLATRSLRTYVVTPRGTRLKVRFAAADLYGLVSLSDLDPVTRARLPGAVAAARRGDGAPLARVLTGTVAALGGPAQQGGPVSDALFAATTCAEAPLPWSPASAPERRPRPGAVRARAPAGQQAVRALRPRRRDPASFLAQCKRWPAVHAGRAGRPRPGPAVPTLVINGSEDLRTPVEEGRELAAAYPGGRALAVPGAGHSAITTDTTRCAPRAGFAFLAGAPAPAACPRAARAGAHRRPPAAIAARRRWPHAQGQDGARRAPDRPGHAHLPAGHHHAPLRRPARGLRHGEPAPGPRAAGRLPVRPARQGLGPAHAAAAAAWWAR